MNWVLGVLLLRGAVLLGLSVNSLLLVATTSNDDSATGGHVATEGTLHGGVDDAQLEDAGQSADANADIGNGSDDGKYHPSGGVDVRIAGDDDDRDDGDRNTNAGADNTDAVHNGKSVEDTERRPAAVVGHHMGVALGVTDLDRARHDGTNGEEEAEVVHGPEGDATSGPCQDQGDAKVTAGLSGTIDSRVGLGEVCGLVDSGHSSKSISVRNVTRAIPKTYKDIGIDLIRVILYPGLNAELSFDVSTSRA